MLGQESKRSQEGGTREERKWEEIYSNLNASGPLSVAVRINKPLEGLSFMANDWGSRLQALMSEISIHGAHPDSANSPLSDTDSKGPDFCVFRPRNSYIRSYQRAQATADGALFPSERETDLRTAEYDMDEHGII